MTIPLSLILASDADGAIGDRDTNDMPWGRLPEDMKFFRQMTSDCPVIMGKNTFMSLPGGLAGRAMIVVSKNSHAQIHKHCKKISANVVIKDNLKDAIEHGRLYAEMESRKQVFIIGGQSVYREALPFANNIYWTKIHERFPNGNIFFDPLFEVQGIWKNFSLEHIETVEAKRGFKLTFSKITHIQMEQLFKGDPIGFLEGNGLFCIDGQPEAFDPTKINRVSVSSPTVSPGYIADDSLYVVLHLDNGTTYKSKEIKGFTQEQILARLSGIIARARR